MKPDIKGETALMQGYEARLGLGITRIRNQIVDNMPSRKINSPEGTGWWSIQFLILANLPFGGQMQILFLFPTIPLLFLSKFGKIYDRKIFDILI
jgi:hypothetical protein